MMMIIPSANLHSMERKTGVVSAALVEAGLTIVDYLVPLLLPSSSQIGEVWSVVESYGTVLSLHKEH